MGAVIPPRSIIRKNSTGSEYIRRRINLIEGTNVTLTVADDSTDNEVDVTISSSVGGGGNADTLDNFDSTAFMYQPVNLLKNGNFINNSTNGYGGTPDDWTNSSGNPVQGGFPTMTKQQLIDLLGIADGDIEGLWNLNEASGNAIDLSSNGYNLTDTNTVTNNADGLMSGGARLFTSANSEYFTLADASITNLKLTGSQTFFTLVKPVAGVTNRFLIGRCDAGATNAKLIYLDGSGKPTFQLNGLTTNVSVTTTVTAQANKWYFLVGVYDSTASKLKIWVNGIKTEVTASGSASALTSSFGIGRAGEYLGNYFDGLMNNAGVLSVALSDSQVQRLWAFTSYKGIKVRRSGSDGYVYQSLPEDLVERLRGKSLTLAADIAQDTASIGQLEINDGSAGTSTVFTTTGSYVETAVTKTISATATSIQVRLKAITSNGNVWFKKVRLYESSVTLPYQHSPDDWYRFPKLLRMAPAKTVDAYQFEEKRWFSYTPSYTGFSSNPSGSSDKFMVDGYTCNVKRAFNTQGTSNATGFTFTLPVLSGVNCPTTTGITQVWDNGAYQTTPGSIYFGASAITASAQKNTGGGAFTASSTKDITIYDLKYEID